MTEPTIARRRVRGYSLIEVLIAMGLLSTVLLVIVTLFFMARSNVYSGKQTTHAVAVGTRIMEDLSSMSVPTVYSTFSITDTTGLGAADIALKELIDEKMGWEMPEENQLVEPAPRKRKRSGG